MNDTNFDPDQVLRRIRRGVNQSLIERELLEGAFSFENIGAHISQWELRSIEGEMVPRRGRETEEVIYGRGNKPR